MSKRTQLYHSEMVSLCNGQWLSVQITSDVLRSKFNKPGEDKHYCEMTLNGEPRSYFVENPACGNALRGRKNQTIFIIASGSRDDAQIQVDPNAPPASAQAPQQHQAPPPQQHQPPPQQQHHNAPPPAQTSAPKNNDPLPVFGQTVGMAINNSCEFLRVSGKPFDAKFVYETASDIIRISRSLEGGKLAPKANDKGERIYPTKKPAAEPPPPPPPPPVATPPPASTDAPPTESDDVPF